MKMLCLKRAFLLIAVLDILVITVETASNYTITRHYTTSALPENFYVYLWFGSSLLDGAISINGNGMEYAACNVSKADGIVICKMLGMQHGPASPYVPSPFVSRFTNLFTESFQCHGNETNIRFCSPKPPSSSKCSASWLDCRTQVRLVGGNNVSNGIIEILVNGTWGTVCENNFDHVNADVFCRMLGYYGTQNTHTSGNFASLNHSVPIWINNLRCYGKENDVAQCNFPGWGNHNCGHNNDVWLHCDDSSISTIWTTSSYLTTTWWYYTTKSYLVENTISSSCTSSGWYIQVDMYRLKQIYPDARASDIYLGENSCTGYSNGYTLVFQNGIRSCLTSETETQTALVYRNRLFYAMRDPQHPFIIRGYNWTVDVECDVMRNESVSNHISHNTQRPLDSGHVQGTSHYNVTLRFYTDFNFQYEIPGNPLHVKVGDDVYVKAYTDTADWAVKMAVHTCYTKPDPYASDSVKYYLIKDGCETDVNTHYISQSTHETKFMFRDFEYTSNHEGLFIYCDSTFCETSDYSNQCQQSCNPIGKRSAESRPRLTETVQERIIHNHK